MCRLISLIACVCLLFSGCSDKSSLTSANPHPGYVLIDPGHGGFDGGAVASDNTQEKHVNLSISLTLRDLLQVFAIPVNLTRETDQALDATKSGDMQARLALYQQAETVLSIHQNHFDIPKYAGAQVFYSGNHPQSQTLAASVQSAIQSLLQTENRREIKKTTNGIFLLHNATVPCVLVECGFLSNPEEREHLKSHEYQQKMAFAIVAGYWNYKTTK